MCLPLKQSKSAIKKKEKPEQISAGYFQNNSFTAKSSYYKSPAIYYETAKTANVESWGNNGFAVA